MMNISELIRSENQLNSQGLNLNEAASSGDPAELREEFSRILDKIARELRSRGVAAEQVIELGQATAEVRRVLQDAAQKRPLPQADLRTAEPAPLPEPTPNEPVHAPAEEEAADEPRQVGQANEETAESAPEKLDPNVAPAAKEEVEQELSVGEIAGMTMAAPVASQQVQAESSSEEPNSQAAVKQNIPQELRSEEQQVELEGPPSAPAPSSGVVASPIAQEAVPNEPKVAAANHMVQHRVIQPEAATENNEVTAAVADDVAMFLAALKDRPVSAQELLRPMLGAAQRLSPDAQTILVSSMLQLGVVKQALDAALGQDGRSVSGVKAGAAVTPQLVQGGISGQRPLVTDAPRAQRQATRTQLLRAFERVENALKEVAQSKDGKSIQVRLEPDQLGKVRVSVTMREGVLHARVVPDSSSVVEALRERAHELHTMLRRLGMDVDRIEVSIGSEYANEGMTQSQGRSSDRSSRGHEAPQGQLSERIVAVEEGEVQLVNNREMPISDDGHWVA